MKKYFTSINEINNQYVGTVYDAITNQIIYTSNPYISQSQVVQEINNFLKTNKQISETAQTSLPSIAAPPQTIQNTIKMQPMTPVRTGRCCGR